MNTDTLQFLIPALKNARLMDDPEEARQLKTKIRYRTLLCQAAKDVADTEDSSYDGIETMTNLDIRTSLFLYPTIELSLLRKLADENLTDTAYNEWRATCP